jgi:hypothetical protein
VIVVVLCLKAAIMRECVLNIDYLARVDSSALIDQRWQISIDSSALKTGL